MKHKLLFLLCLVMINAHAQQTVTCRFAQPQLVDCGDGFSKLLIENCSFLNEEGTPDIPVFAAKILLEPGHEITTVNITSIEYYPVIEDISICPASARFPISKGAPDGYRVVPNTHIYNADKNYPEMIVKGENTSFLRGYAFGAFLIYPVRYNPVQKIAEVIKSITIEVNSQTTPKAQEALKFLRNDQSTEKRIEQIKANKDGDILNNYKSLCKRNTNPNYDLLVVTVEDFTNALDNYILHKNKWGYKVLVKTVEEIIENYTGIDDAEKIRNCVIDAYINEGISYLMFFGDSHSNSNSPHNLIPYRKLRVDMGTNNDDIASDMYFACLDGTWYNSYSGLWGEEGYDDLNHEISVGRICADNVDEIETFVTKLMKYQDNPVIEDVNKALMVGEKLDDSPTWGGDCKDQIASGGWYNGYYTAGVPSNFTINKLYEREGNWTTTQLRNQFNETGTHLVNHFGHSNVTYNMKLNSSGVNNNSFKNDGTQRMLAIAYSQGCYNGSFDNTNDSGGSNNTDCINEKFHKINGGVVANIGNTRYGWYYPGWDEGPSNIFDRYFFDGIFGKSIYHIGDANSYSKDIIQPYIEQDLCLRWCCYELTLLGDPSMDIWTDTPTAFNPHHIKANQIDDYEVVISTSVPYARIAILLNNELISRNTCDAQGNATLYFDTPFDPNAVLLSITGHNKLRYEQQGLDAPPVRNLTADVDGTIVNLQWQAPDLSGKQDPPVYYAIYRDSENIATSEVLNYIDNDSLAQMTTYDYCVKAVYAECISGPVCTQATTELFCRNVENINDSVSWKTITLFWDAPKFTPDKYTIHRDGVFLMETEQSSITDEVPEENTAYEYCIIVHYPDCESEQECKTVNSTVGIAYNQAESFQIYPNPANDYVTVVGENIKEIVIYEMTGKILREISVNGSSQININTSEFSSGLFLIKIINEKSVVTKLFSVIR